MKWERARTSRGEAFDAWIGDGAQIRITVVFGHIGYPDKWVAHIHPLLRDPRELSATTAEEAQAEAVAVARAWLKEALAALGEEE